MNTYLSIIKEIQWESLLAVSLRVLAVLLLAYIIMKILRTALEKMENRLVQKGRVAGEPPSEVQKRAETLVKLLRQAAFVVVWFMTVLVVLRELGFEIAPIIAGAGILGLAVGFGAQNLVRDVISGFFMILENQIRVGDVAVVNGTGGLVERINFRTTVLRDLTGTVHVFPNGTISTLSNMTNTWSAYIFDLGVAYKEDPDMVIKVLEDVGREMKSDDYFGPLMLDDLEIFGVDKFADSAVIIKGRIKTRPIKQWEVGRQFLRRVKKAFDANNIEIPFPHRTIYFGEASKPVDIKLMEQVARTKLK